VKRSSFQKSIIVPSRMVFIMWLVFFIEVKFNFDFGILGVEPRTVHGLIGIISMPFLHGSVTHITSNTLPILLLGTMLFFFYPTIASRVFLQCFFFTNALVWVFARPAIHIGASGLLFALAAFLISFGFFEKDFKSVIISGIVIVIYGSMFFQIIPTSPIVSWESHVLGAVVGVSSAFLIAKNTK